MTWRHVLNLGLAMALVAGCSGKSDPTSSTASVTAEQGSSGSGGSGGSGSGSGHGGSGGGNSGKGSSNSGPGNQNAGAGGAGIDGVTEGVRVRCELRTRSARSKISVDGRDLPSGTYVARVTSGANQQVSGPRAAVGDEVEFDFDSNANDIAEGATAIPASFIQGGTVPGEVLVGQTVVRAATATCRVRA